MAGLMAGTVGGFLGPTQQSPGSEGFLSEEVTNLSGSQLAQGEVVRIVSDDAVTRSQANLPANVQGTVGVAGAVIAAGARGPVVTEGKTTVLLEAGLVGVLAGQTIWVSATVAGRGTNVPPALALGVGIIKDASGYAGNNTVIADLATPVAESFSGFGGVPASIDIGDAGAAGVSGLASRSDHEHPFPAPVAAPPAVAAASATGAATTPARSDHTHAGVASLAAGTGISVSAATGAVTVALTHGATPTWGADNIAAAADTRYLPPGRASGTAPLTAGTQQMVAPRAGTARNLFARHNSAAGNGNSVVYTLLVNGVASTLTVTLATGAAGQASDLVNTVAIAQGDRLEIRAVKALGIGSGAQDAQVSLELL